MMSTLKLSFFMLFVLVCYKDGENSIISETSTRTEIESKSGIKNDFHPGSGILVYDKYEPLKDKPINLHYYIPEEGDMKKMPILFVMHGNSRTAASYLRSWINTAKEKKIMVFAPEFKKELYSSAEYHRGGVVVKNEQQDEKNWSYSVIDPIFQYIKDQTKNTQEKYDIYGHSAGGQFVHRMLLFKPNAQVNQAVAANAGWYLIPDFEDTFPHGLKNSPATVAYLEPYFKKKLTIMVGTADNDPNSKDLNKTSKDMKQGANRYERAYYFYRKSDSISKSHNLPFHWNIKEVEGVAHSNSGMAKAAAAYLYN